MSEHSTAPLSKQKIDKIKALYESGASIYAIAKQMKISCSTAKRHATGFYTRKPKAPFVRPKLKAKWIGDCQITGQRMYMVEGVEHDHIVPEPILNLSDWVIE